MRVSSLANRRYSAYRYSVHLVDSIGNQLILTVYGALPRCLREFRQHTIDASGVVTQRIIAATDWLGEITVSNPTLDCHFVTLVAEHEAEKQSR